MNGWTQANHNLRSRLVTGDNPDIACITETHLKNSETIVVSNYKFYGLNQSCNITNKKRGSGGIGIFVKTDLLQIFTMNRVSEIYDNLLGLELINHDTDPRVIVYCVYIPPRKCKYGQENERLFDLLTMELYKHIECEEVIICGDFNARIGNKLDILDSDEVVDRKVIDQTVTPQGQMLLNLLIDTKTCIVNGRVTPQLDDFTSVAPHKEKAVVDYCITRVNELSHIVYMEVVSCLELVDQQGYQSLVSDNCRLPDHNMLAIKVELNLMLREQLKCRNLGRKSAERVKTLCKFGVNYMKSETATRLLPLMLNQMENRINCQNNLNTLYKDVVDLILNEARSSMANLVGRRKKYQI